MFGKFRGMDRKIAMGLGVVLGAGAISASAEAKPIDANANAAFEDLNAQVEQTEVGESDVGRALENFKNRLVFEVGNPDIEAKIIKKLDGDLEICETPGQKMDAIRIYEGMLDQRARTPKVKEDAPMVETQQTHPGKAQEHVGSPRLDRHRGGFEDAFAEMNKSTEGFSSFFDASVPYEKAVDGVNNLMEPGTSTTYNGIRFVKDRDGKLFCGGKEITPDSRNKMMAAYDYAAIAVSEGTNGGINIE